MVTERVILPNGATVIAGGGENVRWRLDWERQERINH